jgi:hypothetical protein
MSLVTTKLEPPQSTHEHKNTTPPQTGFTVVDTLALGALGHVLGVGIVLGLRATGGL